MTDPTANTPLGAVGLPASPLSLPLAGGRGATLSLTLAATVIAVDGTRVSSYDLCGRPYVLVRGGWTWRRALDGRLLQKGSGGDGSRVRRVVPAHAGDSTLDAARSEVEEVLRVVEGDSSLEAAVRDEALRRLRRIVRMDGAQLRRDAERFGTIYRPVGILPPDQYLALVVQATEGCAWNACAFCELYRNTAFHVKTPDELRDHLAALLDYFGESLALRRSLFLADANALCVPHDQLMTLLETLAAELPMAPAQLAGAGIYSFVDTWSGARKGPAEYREYARHGLRRVYTGLETGDPELLAWLNKPGSPEEAVELVSTLREAGVAVGVIVLLGAGGERFSAAHVSRTAEVLSRMRLGPEDLLYFSELVEPTGREYARRADAEDLQPLGPEACARQRQVITRAFSPADTTHPPRTATYDLREFVY